MPHKLPEYVAVCYKTYFCSTLAEKVSASSATGGNDIDTVFQNQDDPRESKKTKGRLLP